MVNDPPIGTAMPWNPWGLSVIVNMYVAEHPFQVEEGHDDRRLRVYIQPLKDRGTTLRPFLLSQFTRVRGQRRSQKFA